jgi:hypothetical protein
MYALYEKRREGADTRYAYKSNISLFGCNKGHIPKMLRKTLATGASQPCKWHVNIENGIANVGEPGCALIINLKLKDTNLSLYEVFDVWGYSANFWTPVMLYLKGLFVDEKPESFDTRNFVRSPDKVRGPIFSMTYLSGTVQDGKLIGRWTTPGPSSTNAVLLWPDVFRYFYEEAEKIIGSEASRRAV